MQKKHAEYQYLDLMQDILDNGADKELFFNDVVLELIHRMAKWRYL